MNPDPLPEPLATTAHIAFQSNDVLMIISLILLIIVSALFAGAEVAFFSITQTEKELLDGSETNGAKLAQKLLEKPKKLLATILIAKNFLNVLFVLLAAFELTKLWTLAFNNTTFIFTLNTIIISVFLIFIGEHFPKSIAYKDKAAYAQKMSYPIYFFQIIPPFSWLTIPLSKSTNMLEKRAKRKGINISQDALETVLTLSEHASNDHGEYAILQGAVKFGQKEVKQIMCPRMDVVSIGMDASLEQLMDTFIDAGYSRLPVYNESFDNVLGIIFIKDLLPYFKQREEFKWQDYLREPFFVPENKKIADLLNEFQSKKIHLAIVIDEYGGSVGIVTLEDVLEEIVGDITDELDEDENNYTQVDDNTLLIEGRLGLNDFYRIINSDGKPFEDIREDAESVGGLITEVNGGEIPEVDTSTVIGDYEFVVVAADKKRIETVKVIMH